MKKLSTILLALALGFASVHAETVTIKQSSLIKEDKIVNLSKGELSEVNKLSAELKNSGLSIESLESGEAITAEQAEKLNRIVQIIEKDTLAAAAVGSAQTATLAAGATISTWTALSAALLTAIALGSSDSSASTHSHH
ncbi:MAG: hypothetical protein U5K55_01255 [Aliarcobacter sp.]|nr:hypothetical protein [Aliarcobacter sp.]